MDADMRKAMDTGDRDFMESWMVCALHDGNAVMVNELREGCGLPPLPGDTGKEYVTPASWINSIVASSWNMGQ